MIPADFSLPPEELPEPGGPERIEHACDYMLSPGGGLEFYYNFLIYQWTLDGEVITARAYLDEPTVVSVFVRGERLHHEAALAPLVRYLQRRYRVIQSFHESDARAGGTGYLVQFRQRVAR